MLIDSVKQPQKRRPLRPQSHIQGTGARFAKLERRKPSFRRRINWAVVGPIIASPALFGLAEIGPLIAESVVLAYGIIALVARLQSRVSLILALGALVFITALQLGGVQTAASTMAIMAYELLAIGVVSFAFETRRENKMWFRR
jgi:hypothetical protein